MNEKECCAMLGLPPIELCICGSWSVDVRWLMICDLHWCRKCGRRWSVSENDLDGYFDPSGLPEPHPGYWGSSTTVIPAVNALAIVVADEAAQKLNTIVRSQSKKGSEN